jgi:hypothetical protein
VKSEVQQCREIIQALQTSTPVTRQMSDQQVRTIISRLEGQDANLTAAVETIKRHVSTATYEFRTQNQRILPGTLTRVSTSLQHYNEPSESSNPLKLGRDDDKAEETSLREM